MKKELSILIIIIKQCFNILSIYAKLHKQSNNKYYQIIYNVWNFNIWITSYLIFIVQLYFIVVHISQ